MSTQGAIFAILAVMIVLVMVSLIQPWAERRSIPSTLVLACLGIAFGAVVFMVNPPINFGPLSGMIAGLQDLGISPELFLYLFLPPLLFTAGLTIDVRLLIDEIGAVLVMAVVAVFVCTLAVGYALSMYVEYSLVTCLLLGSIVATTDPAAVVSLFRDLGAPRRLTTLISGESVLNDAAAIAIFTILVETLTSGQQIDFAAGLLQLTTDFIGGLALGYVLARITCWVMPAMRNTRVAEITLSVALAYICYILGEQYFDVSGVVAVVAASFTFAVHGRTKATPGTWDPLVQTWQFLDFWANSLIFVLATMFATRVINQAEWRDLVLIGIVVAGALVARGVVLYGLLPLLSAVKATHRVGPKYKAVILWGGLRGALTLTLALSVNENPEIPDDLERFILTLATGFVLFTLLVQATTLKPLLNLLGLSQLTPMELALRDRAVALSRSQVHEQVKAVAREYGFDPVLAADVVPAVNDEQSGNGENGDHSLISQLSEPDRLQVGLLTLATREKELYLRHYADGTMSRQMVTRMVTDADRLIDRVKIQGLEGYQANTSIAVRVPFGLRVALRVHRYTGWSRPLAIRLSHRFERLIVSQLVVRELARFNKQSIEPLLGSDVSAELGDVINARLDGIMTALEAVEVQYPSYTQSLRHHYLERAALRLEEAQYRRQLQESLIGREIYADLERGIDRRRAILEERAQVDLGLRLKEMLARAPLFGALDDTQLHQVARCLKPHLAVPGERVIKKGTPGNAMYFIVSGSVEVRLPKNPIALKSGEFFGELSLLTRQPRVADVVSQGYCQLLALEARDFRLLLRTIPELKEKIEAVAENRIEANRQGSDQASS
ncbi:MAG: cyclic nucleotide-binding domain-containing protein [Alphaproteobacteria bacterium]|nr:cyclic nucleotide-binding domain-containing protein [Alphaproteobacteria bacterium]